MCGESLASRPCEMIHLRVLPSQAPSLKSIPGRRGLPERPLLRIRQAWPQVDGRRLLTCLCGQLLPPCGYVQLLQLCISGIALTPSGYVWLLQLCVSGIALTPSGYVWLLQLSSPLLWLFVSIASQQPPLVAMCGYCSSRYAKIPNKFHIQFSRSACLSLLYRGRHLHIIKCHLSTINCYDNIKINLMSRNSTMALPD